MKFKKDIKNEEHRKEFVKRLSKLLNEFQFDIFPMNYILNDLRFEDIEFCQQHYIDVLDKKKIVLEVHNSRDNNDRRYRIVKK